MGINKTGRASLIGLAVVVCLGAAGVATWGVEGHRSSGDSAFPAPIVTPASAPSMPASRPSPLDVAPTPQVTVPALPGPAAVTESLATLSLNVPPGNSTAVSVPDPGGAVSASSAVGATSSSGALTPPSTVTPPASVAPPTTTTPLGPAAALPSQYAHILGWVSGGKVVSLTFDDGPSPYSGRVLDILARYGIKATFCQIGEQVGSYPAVEARIRAAGHTLCNHSWDHDEELPAKPVSMIDSEISRTQLAISAATGETPRYYRAPGGDWGHGAKLKAELAKFHTIPLAWADDSLDWTKPGVDKIVKNVLGTVTPGAIILLHDGGGDRTQTLAALPKIIAGLRAKGYTFVGLPASPSA